MKLSQHFSYQEFIKSQTATRKGISNEPDDTQLYNMKMICANILEPVRVHFGKPADFEIPGVSNKELADWIHDNLPYDQLILEFFDGKDPNSGWVHCSHKSENRGQYLIAYKDENKKTKYAPAI